MDIWGVKGGEIGHLIWRGRHCRPRQRPGLPRGGLGLCGKGVLDRRWFGRAGGFGQPKQSTDLCANAAFLWHRKP